MLQVCLICIILRHFMSASPRAPGTLLSTRRYRRRSLAVTSVPTTPFDVAALLTQKGMIACEENEHANIAPRQANQRQRKHEDENLFGRLLVQRRHEIRL